jgi:hypothetical protein
VQVLDVHVVRGHRIRHLRFLARVPELVEAVVTRPVTQFERDRETAAFVEVPVFTGGLVLETAAHAVTRVQRRLELRRFLRLRGQRGEQEGESSQQGAEKTRKCAFHGQNLTIVNAISGH